MLDFITFIDDIYIYSTIIDEWGLNKISDTPTKVTGFIRETVDNIEFKNQKGKNVVSKYTISLSGSDPVRGTDLIGIEIDGSVKQFEILNIVPIRDLSGECVFKKVYI